MKTAAQRVHVREASLGRGVVIISCILGPTRSPFLCGLDGAGCGVPQAKFMAELDKVKQQLNELEGRGALTSLTQLHCMQNGQEERTLVVQLG